LREGGPVDHANAKLYVTWKTLGLRAERAAAFTGSYEPVHAGEGVCAFMRGGEVLVAAAVRPDAIVRVPEGWHDVLGVEGLALCVRPAREALVDVV
jgi:(1->4)-alpha-D-glucan 1-alpha-D-glucosylmutase